MWYKATAILPAGDQDEVEPREDGRNYRPKHVELIEMINEIIIVTSIWLFILVLIPRTLCVQAVVDGVYSLVLLSTLYYMLTTCLFRIIWGNILQKKNIKIICVYSENQTLRVTLFFGKKCGV